MGYWARFPFLSQNARLLGGQPCAVCNKQRLGTFFVRSTQRIHLLDDVVHSLGVAHHQVLKVALELLLHPPQHVIVLDPLLLLTRNTIHKLSALNCPQVASSESPAEPSW